MLHPESICIGQEVILNSGGPTMTIETYTCLHDGTAPHVLHCLVCWQDDEGNQRRERFLGATLSAVGTGSTDPWTPPGVAKPMEPAWETAPQSRKTSPDEMEKNKK